MINLPWALVVCIFSFLPPNEEMMMCSNYFHGHLLSLLVIRLQYGLLHELAEIESRQPHQRLFVTSELNVIIVLCDMNTAVIASDLWKELKQAFLVEPPLNASKAFLR